MCNYPEKGIWSKVPANKWEEGYVLGNGELGGILYGHPCKFNLIVNHYSCYLKGNPMDTIPDLSGKLPELREVITSEGYQKGIEFFEKEALKKGYPGLTMSDLYHPAAQIKFSFPELEGVSMSDYSRQLDFEKGLIEENYDIGKNQWFTKESFVSRDQSCLYVHIQSDKLFDISFNLVDFEKDALNQEIIKQTSAYALQKNTYIDGSNYLLSIKWKINKGKVHVENDQIIIRKTKQLTLAVSVNMNSEDLNIEDFDSIKAKHIRAHSNQYNSVSLDLVSQDERAQDFESIIKEMTTTKEVPLVLYEKMYDASRYVIQSMSGKALPNLQGIWSGDFHPAWSGDFTFDTNVQLAMASYASLGWFEGFNGLFNQMEKYLDDFKENARKYYGCRGYLVPVHASTRALHVHWNSEWPLIFWTAGAGWLAHFYHEYYEYTLDKIFLKETAVPFYIETLLFYEDLLESEQGNLILKPSYSAENGMGDTSTMDVAVIKETIKNLTYALTILDEEIPDKYIDLLNELPDYLIDSEGELKEWIDDQTVENHNHRHFSNLYPVFQTKEITKKEPILWKAAQTAFDKRLQAWLYSDDGDTSSSHGRMHTAMCAIALERPMDIEASLKELLLNQSFYPSLVTSHYNNGEVFNVDANGSLPKVIHDSLIYVERLGEITLFKATPEWLIKGRLTGMRLPDGVTVQKMEWNLSEYYCELILIANHSTELKIAIQDMYLFKDIKDASHLTVTLIKDDPITLKLALEFAGENRHD